MGDDEPRIAGVTARYLDRPAGLVIPPEAKLPSLAIEGALPLTPRFATLTLPPRFDGLPLLTRLWLQSRVVRNDDRKAVDSSDDSDGGEGSDDDDASGQEGLVEKPDIEKGTDEKGIDPKTGKESKMEDRDDDLEFREPGYGRPFSIAAVGLHLDLLRSLWPYTVRAIHTSVRKHPWAVLGYTLNVLAEGIMPALTTWTKSRVLDMVERSFSGPAVPWREALLCAGAAVGAELASHLAVMMWNKAVTVLSNYVTYSCERTYFTAKLGMSLPQMTDPVQTALLYEGGVFAGVEAIRGSRRPFHGPWTMIDNMGETIGMTIAISAQIVILVHPLLKMTKVFSLPQLLLLTLSIGPIAIEFLENPLIHWFESLDNDRDSKAEGSAREEEDALRVVLSDDDVQQEVVLFGLKGWVIQRWDAIATARHERESQRQLTHQYVYTIIGVLRATISNSFYVLLATKALATNLTLGSINMHMSTGRDVMWRVKDLQRHLQVAYQVPYYAAAFASLLDGVPRPGPQLNFEDYRGEPGSGMRIVTRDLRYTYPGADKPTLRGINLVIESGETLAIVGPNGGGKTSLLKTLLGLHDHEGTLEVNGIAIQDYAHETLHARMSCLFQDYAKYNLTLRTNVGVGDTAKMDDTPAILDATERGGADGLVEKFGLECVLDPHGLPGHRERKNNDWDDTDEDSEDDDGARVSSSALSGGQWQRTALSRAFMRADSAALVAFDEPSASLDPQAEADLFDRIHALSHRDGGTRTTTIFISHRYSTVRRADRIAYVEDGQIVEYGSHAELMALDGKYAHAFNLQRSAFDDGATPATVPATPRVDHGDQVETPSGDA